MKKIYILFAATVISGFASGLFSQPGERLDALRIAFYTRKLNLTSDEAKVFWPVYDKFAAERKTIRDKAKIEKLEMKLNFETMSDKDAEVLLDEFILSRQAELDLYKSYVVEFKKVLPAKKVALLMRVEQDFKQELMKQIQERQGGGPPPGGHRGPPPGRNY